MILGIKIEILDVGKCYFLEILDWKNIKNVNLVRYLWFGLFGSFFWIVFEVRSEFRFFLIDFRFILLNELDLKFFFKNW